MSGLPAAAQQPPVITDEMVAAEGEAMTRIEILRILNWPENAGRSNLLARVMRVADAAAAAERERIAAGLERWAGDLRTTEQPSMYRSGRVDGLHDAAQWVRAGGG